MTVCDWRNGERTLVGHVRACWAGTLRYTAVMVTLIFITMLLDMFGAL